MSAVPTVKLCSDCRHHNASIPAPRVSYPNATRITFCGLAVDTRGKEARDACQGRLWEPRR